MEYTYYWNNEAVVDLDEAEQINKAITSHNWILFNVYRFVYRFKKTRNGLGIKVKIVTFPNTIVNNETKELIKLTRKTFMLIKDVKYNNYY